MIALDGKSLTLAGLIQIVNHGEAVSVAESAKAGVLKSRESVERVAKSGVKTYAINTGFGSLSSVTIGADKLETLQVNFLRSHCAGVGEPLTEWESRSMLALRLNALAKGYSGVRLSVLEMLVLFLNHGVHPVIPCQGSVGSSGDLAPLAHLAITLMGEGEVFYQGERMDASKALKAIGVEPLKLSYKEGLALTNGTQYMTAMGASLLAKAEELSDLADLICSASLDGLLGSPSAFDAWIHEARPHQGQKVSARNLKAFLKGSQIVDSHKDCDRVQDVYSLRCAPQVHGACRDLFEFVRKTLEVELNSATDNPLVHPESGEIVSGGNFHGQPLAFGLDILAMGLSELSSISERRTAKLINPSFSGLPAYLTKEEGLCSGYMIPQYTSASLVVENRTLCHPASTDSIPTSNDKEDHNSMGPVSARKAKVILNNTAYVLAIEALVACQALDLRAPLKSGAGPARLLTRVRKEIPTLVKDRVHTGDIEKVASWIRSGELHGLVKELVPR